MSAIYLWFKPKRFGTDLANRQVRKSKRDLIKVSNVENYSYFN